MINECRTCRFGSGGYDPTVACLESWECQRTERPENEEWGVTVPCPLWEPRGEISDMRNQLELLRGLQAARNRLGAAGEGK